MRAEDCERNLRLFFVFTFLRSFFLIGPVITLFYLEFIPFDELGIVFAAGLATALVFEMPSGVWADHLGRRRIVAIGTAIAALELVLIAYGQSFWFFLAAGVLGGLGSALVSGADTSLVYDSLLAAKRARESRSVYGRIRAIRYVSIVIAALIGAPLYAYANTWPLYLNAVVLAGAALLVLAMREPPVAKPTGLRAQFETLRNGIRAFISDAKLRWFVSFAVFSGLSVWIFHDMFRLPYYEAIGFPIIALGLVVSTVSIIRSVVSWNAHRIESFLGAQRTITLLLVSVPILLLLVSVVRTPLALGLIIVLYAIWSLQEVAIEAALHERIPSAQRATGYSVYSFANSIMLLMFSIVAGVIAASSLFSAIAFLGAIGTLAAVLLSAYRQ